MSFKHMTVDFFRIVIDGEQKAVANCFEQIMDIHPNKDDRGYSHYSSYYNLHDIKKNEQGYFGTLLRVRTKEDMIKANIRGDIFPIETKDDEGIGEISAFMYSIKYRVFVLQRNYHGPSITSIKRMLPELSQATNIKVTLLPILEKELLDKIAESKKITSATFSIARPDRLDSSSNTGIHQHLKETRQYDAYNVEVIFRSEKGKNSSLNKKEVMIDISEYLSSDMDAGSILGKAIIRTEGEDGKKHRYDLINGRLHHKISFEEERNFLNIDSRYGALIKAFDFVKPSIIDQFLS